MTKLTRPVAVPAAVIVFFLMAGMGVYNSVSLHALAWRAFVGAVITYVVVTIAARFAIKLVVDAMVRSRLKNKDANQ